MTICCCQSSGTDSPTQTSINRLTTTCVRVNKPHRHNASETRHFLRFMFNCLGFVLHQFSFPLKSCVSSLQLWRLNAKYLNNTKVSSNELLLFNRIPRTGSTTLLRLLQLLGKRNNFGLEESAPLPLPFPNQLHFVQQKYLAHHVTKLSKHCSAFVHVRSVPYINFRIHKLPQPIYVNLV